MTEEAVRLAMDNIDKLEREEAKRHQDAKDALLRERKHIQALCPHPRWVHVPDASGNNGSWDYCDTCGLES